MVALPNLPAEDVAAGGKENNQVVRVYGEKPVFDWEPKNHVDLCTDLGLIDYERGVKMGGNGFWLYTGVGARLEWALLNYFITEHLKDGYTFMLPPHLLTYECGLTAGQFPKFEDDVYRLTEEGFRFLLPTAETALINLYRGDILSEDELPKRLFAYTPCYRREAGAYRASERGMIRGHQFNKVEMFGYTRPDDSDKMLRERIDKACRLVEGLGLHYRLSKLAAGDCSASMATTYDIELWIPSMNEYKECSSVSNARDYQARRGNIRFRRNETKKLEFVHRQRLRSGHQPPDARHRRAVPAAGRQRRHSRKAAAVDGRHGENIPQALNHCPAERSTRPLRFFMGKFVHFAVMFFAFFHDNFTFMRYNILS